MGPIRILLVEDNPADARWVREMLTQDSPGEFELRQAPTVYEAVDRLAANGTGLDAVLLDLTLPDDTGLNTLQRVVAATQTAVVIVITGEGDEELGLAAMQAGAQDYLVKGQVDGRTLRRALRFALERQNVLQRLTHRDDLTGLFNRRGFMTQAPQIARAARRAQAPFLLLFMDMDDLKRVNDTFGHAEGNRALIEAADVLRRCFRQSDLLARFGGDEFAAVALSSGEADEALMRARLQGALDDANVKADREYPLSFSVGIIRCPPSERCSIDELLERADQLMYRAKRSRSDVATLTGSA